MYPMSTTTRMTSRTIDSGTLGAYGATLRIWGRWLAGWRYPVSMLLLLDLDNTLIDRDGAFRQWAEQLVAEHGGGALELEALIQADAGGYSPRLVVAEQAKASLDLPESLDVIVEHMKAGVVDLIRCYEGVMT